MASPASNNVQLSQTEQKDLDKFTKYLSMKAVQVVVQSRLGNKMSAPSNPDISAGTTWFNLAVSDSSEVQSETKRSLSGSIPAPGLPLVCEVSLKTAEGDSLVLEVWRLAVVAGGDPTVKVTHQVYNKMSLLLKSLVTVARVTPAYKLSRRQGSDSYVICYRVMLGDPASPPDLGEGALTARVGQVTTPVSTIVCCVDYRTNMTITQRQTSQPILVKSDHFEPGSHGSQGAEVTGSGLRLYQGRGSGPFRHSDCESSDTGDRGGVTSDESQDAMRIFATSPLDRDLVYGGHRPRTDSTSSVSSQDKFKCGAFASDKTSENLPSLEEELAGEPLLQLLPRQRPSSAISVTSGETMSNTSATDTETQFHMSSDSGSRVQLTDITTAASRTQTTPKIIQDQKGARPKAKRSVSDLGEGSSSSSVPTSGQTHDSLMRKASGGSLFGTAELAQDFVMIDMKTPFAQADASTSAPIGFSPGSSSDPSLGSFFKDVSAAPQLTTLTEQTDLVSQMESVSQQLDNYESRMNEYDDLLQMMGSGDEADT